jgi:two-component system, OmpR family, sensor histidine kinase TctE
MSFAARLLEWLLAPLLFLWLLALGITFLSARETVDTALDDRLNATLAVLHDEWQARGHAAPGATASIAPTTPTTAVERFPSAALSRLLNVGTDYPVRYLIADENGRVLSGEEDLLPLLREGGELIRGYRVQNSTPALEGSNTVIEDDFVRMLRVRVDVNGQPHRVVVVQSRAKQAKLLRSILWHEAIPQTVVLLIAIFLSWYGLTYVIRPMRTLKEHLDSRGGNDLRPLPVQLAPAEIEPLIQSINSLMKRLESSIAAQKRFIANAAHQLRTPLAALRAQSELMQASSDMRHREHALAQLLQTSSRANRLANQLLSLARAESAATTSQTQTVELNELCESVAHDMLPQALERNIDFSFERAEIEQSVLGDPTLLGEMVRNLVDNAFKYTPRGKQVSLTVLTKPARIVVEDAGDGIAESDRERVFAPFTRVPKFDEGGTHLIAGTGLGLAIVLEVASAHGAHINIESSRWFGAKFVVTFVDKPSEKTIAPPEKGAADLL